MDTIYQVVLMFEKISTVLQFLLAHPVVVVIIVIISLMLYRIQLWAFQRTLNDLYEIGRTGWVTQASAATWRHASGIGTQNSLVMRPPRRQLKVAIWSLLFFGGGAMFMWLGVLSNPVEQTAKSWFSFASFALFSAVALYLALDAFTRIRILAEDIVQHRLLRRPRRFALGEISVKSR